MEADTFEIKKDFLKDNKMSKISHKMILIRSNKKKFFQSKRTKSRLWGEATMIVELAI